MRHAFTQRNFGNSTSRLIGTPAAPVIIDVRIDEDFVQDPDLVPTARRHTHDDVAALASELAGKHAVIYCQKGKKLSQGSMAILRNHQVRAEALEGGHFAWRDAGELLVPAD